MGIEESTSFNLWLSSCFFFFVIVVVEPIRWTIANLGSVDDFAASFSSCLQLFCLLLLLLLLHWWDVNRKRNSAINSLRSCRLTPDLFLFVCCIINYHYFFLQQFFSLFCDSFSAIVHSFIDSFIHFFIRSSFPPSFSLSFSFSRSRPRFNLSSARRATGGGGGVSGREGGRRRWKEMKKTLLITR